ncbi:LexA family protein [Modicisalibacter coralii]|uniref:LexA family protein n=1 Tax=Modicisalibacter coralii TaxID=2304602 RepID=UPI001396BEE9|nr:S24 family peptidase [Halomonas coralii]
MSDQSTRIKHRRKELKLTQEKLSKAVGVSRVAISQWESDPTIQIAGKNLTKLCQALKCSTDWLLEGKGGADMGVSQQTGTYQANSNVSSGPALRGLAPEISWVQAGAWTEVCHVELDPEAVNWYPRPPGASDRTFVLRVVGESMLPEYPPGRLIFVDPERIADSGDDVVAVMTETGEATFKRFIEEPGSGKMLKAINPAWHEPYIQINGNCRVVGVVVADMRIR